ncbi:uncharacterized protein LOC129892801 [Solanum dulcamara]|uniref:uncharacterized protein LOC129892801 n=1 Tax=Solanum dulcamara TaxID=45834 RepID=UPI002486AFD5|nr:uncharacterized protein LOC129892801 [Solanum dulcamara]
MVLDVRDKMKKFVSSLGRHVKKVYQVALFILDMDASRLMEYSQQVEENKKNKTEEHQSKRERSKDSNRNDQIFRRNLHIRVQGSQLQGSVAKGPTRTPLCRKYRNLHLGECHACTNGCYNCDQIGDFYRDCLMGR